MTNNPYQGSFILGYSPNPDDPLDVTSVYETTASYGGQVNLRFVNGQFIPYNPGSVLAGAFEMNGINKEGKRIRITEGRFDIGISDRAMLPIIRYISDNTGQDIHYMSRSL